MLFYVESLHNKGYLRASRRPTWSYRSTYLCSSLSWCSTGPLTRNVQQRLRAIFLKRGSLNIGTAFTVVSKYDFQSILDVFPKPFCLSLLYFGSLEMLRVSLPMQIPAYITKCVPHSAVTILFANHVKLCSQLNSHLCGGV